MFTMFIAVLMYLGFIQPVPQQMQRVVLQNMIMNNQPQIDQVMMNPNAQQPLNEIFVPQVAKIEIIDTGVGN